MHTSPCTMKHYDTLIKSCVNKIQTPYQEFVFKLTSK